MLRTAIPDGVHSENSGPISNEFHKRAVYRSAPRHFEAIGLPPNKFGKEHYFGLQIYPIGDDHVRVSIISASTNSAYEIWRTWDDCLWFQDLMETRYGFISHAKRQRLRAGKGVKKNGMYIHDRASSFESLPPGPDPRSVAKDLHQYLPKLTQRGSFFGVSQATVDQRHNEFSALIKALFADDVPSLINELREDSVIKDFFGYWRRDYDLAVKKGRHRPKTASFDSVRNSFFSSFFSTSSASLPTARGADSPPVSPQSTSWSQRSHIIAPTPSLSETNSVLSTASKPPSPPASARLGSRRSLSNRSKNSPSPRSETFNVTSDFPLFLSSSTRDLLPTSRPPHSPSYVTPALGTLPEDSVPDSSASDTPRLTLRNPSDFPVNAKRANRKVVILPECDEVSSSEGDALEGELLTPVDGPDFNMFVGRSTRMSCSSPPPSSTFSDLSSQSDGSYWRTSSENTWPSSASSNDSESVAEIDFPHMACADSIAELEGFLPPPMASNSISTLRDSSYSRRRRSLSQPLPVGSSIPTDVGEDDWSDQGEDLMDAYLGGPQSIFAPNVRDSLSNYDNVPCDFPLDVPDDAASVISFSTSRERIPTMYGPPRALHRPRPSGTTSLTRPPPSSQSSRTMSMSSSCNAARGDGSMLVIKAALDDAKVVLRVQRDAPLTELRQRVLEKFAQTEGTLLRGAYDLSYLPPSPALGGGGAGRNRASTISSMSTTSLATVDWTSALPLRNERDWETAIASCGSKITLRVTCRSPSPQ